jgi:putative ATP-dependent endonuclease of OLD family
MNEDRISSITLTGSELNDILKQLDLILEDNKSGLGSLNMLFMASELLLLENNKVGLNLTLIEELEAHLHTQYQLRIIDFIQRRNKFGQFILTTHSTTLASKIDLKNLLICTKDGNVFPMGPEHTQLEEGDYKFLERFLDATKANLFFAKGVIFVEGDAENLLLPTIAELIDKPLHKYGVSIVNIGNTAFLRYSRIFTRKKEPFMNIPVAVITDLDFRPLEYHEEQIRKEMEKEKKYKFPDIYMITDKNITELQELTKVIDFNELKNTSYEHKTEFEDVLKSFKKRPNFERGNVKNRIIETCKEELNRDNFDQVKNKTHGMKSKYYQNEDQKVKSFVSPNWTLEYELALSHINNELFQAIKRAEILKRGNRITLSDLQKEYIKKHVDKFFSSKESASASKIAYEIYNYLLEKKISKAVTAQCLSDILLENKNIGETDSERRENWTNFKKTFQTEVKKVTSPLKYIIDAIEYVTSVYNNDVEVS